MTKSLGDWVCELESADLLVRVDEEIDPKYVAAVVSKNYRKATLVENIRGYEMPLLANSFSNRKMIALALGVAEERLIEALTEKMSKRVRPAMIPSHKQAACQEVVLTGEEVDLTRFPLHLQHELDGAPYISAGGLVANNPLNDATNLGIYRMMFRTKNETGIDLTAPHKLRRFFQTAMERNEGPLEVACVLGLHALDMLSSEATAPDDVDEYEVLGGFRGEPVELVKCKTIDVQVP
ncbi:MAG: UbiD family decarboxylase, partial [Thaumarchaeota archaeon]|nr:UbiD family decarboxylase [Nitrososphaerota archaeon]